MKALIVDDELLSRKNISALLRANCPEISEIFESDSADSAIKLVHKETFDLVFLDIEMPIKSGFDFLAMVANFHLEVIFCTAHDQYAIRAFKFNAIDYLLKPIDEVELIMAVQRAEENIRLKRQTGSFNRLVETLANPDKKPDQLAVRVAEGIRFIRIDTIVRLLSDRNYTTIFYSDNQKLVVAKPIKDYEEMLLEFGFYRIHNSHMINMASIQSYDKEAGGYVTMTDGTKIEISRRRKDGFLEIVSDRFL